MSIMLLLQGHRNDSYSMELQDITMNIVLIEMSSIPKYALIYFAPPNCIPDLKRNSSTILYNLGNSIDPLKNAYILQLPYLATLCSKSTFQKMAFASFLNRK